MASWLVWNTGLLVSISSVGAVGGSINNLINKQENKILEEIEEVTELDEGSKTEPLVTASSEVPQQQRKAPAAGVRTTGFCQMLRWSVPRHRLSNEEKCKERLEIRLGKRPKTTNSPRNSDN